MTSKKIKLLLVEDNPLVMKIQKVLFEQLDCEIATAVCGSDAIEQCQKHYFDVIFIDIGLPDMDGFMLIEALQKLDRSYITTVPMFILTANSDEEYRKKASAAKVKFMVKPLTQQLAAEVIASLFHDPNVL